MVLPDRIELSTSPLPMECSTTELRQHARDFGEAAKRGPPGRPILAKSLPPAQARGTIKTGHKSALARCFLLHLGRLRAGPVPLGAVEGRRVPVLRTIVYSARDMIQSGV